MNNFDVIIIGYGPTGKVLARQLSDGGHSVAIVERWPNAYPLPRAVGYDHEIKRIFHSMGIAEEVEKISRPMHHYIWYNADWKVLLDIDQTPESPSGGSQAFLFNQPELERVLEKDLEERSGISLFLSNEALSVEDLGDSVRASIAPINPETQKPDETAIQELTARYVVGCDGANSFVRQAMDSEVTDFGFDSNWLVIDAELNENSDLDIPDAAQWCNPDRPTTIVPSGVSTRRWEFMVKPGEDPKAIAEEENVWKLLSKWMKPEDGKLIRQATYNFRSLLVRGWRKNRMLVAGDAAHLMPPFMGQGMCSGLRDAWNLGWKLNLVLSGKSDDALLDTYEVERSAHVEAVIHISVEMGKVVCISDPAHAAGRDEAFFSGNVPPPPVLPNIGSDIIPVDTPFSIAAVAGALLPHDELEKDGVTKRMDDITGAAFTLIVRELSDQKTHKDIKALAEANGIHIIELGASSYRDVNGRLSAYLDQIGAFGILSRPDFYAMGGAETDEDLLALLETFRSSILKA